jgi:protease I
VPRHALTKAGARSEIVSPKPDKVRGWKHGEWGDELDVAVWLERAQAGEYDALLLPGGVINPDRLRRDGRALEFVRAFFEAGKPVAAICHGPWTLIDAGAVAGRKLTSWPSLRSDLENAGAHWLDREVVVDRGLVTSRKPDDLPAFVERMIEEFAEGPHAPARAAAARSTGERSMSKMREALGLIGGAAVGAGIMYLLDPDRGGRRRALIRDQAVHLKRKSADAASAAGRDLANRARGVVAETRSRLRIEELSDRRLVERVRAQLGHVTRHPATIAVESSGGRVRLSGPVLGSEVDPIVAAVRRTKGVLEVEDRLERHDSADGIAALQAAYESGPAVARSWPPGGRLLASTAGSLLALAALRSNGGAGRLLGVAGGGLLMASLVVDPHLRRRAAIRGNGSFAGERGPAGDADTMAPAERIAPLA